MNYTGNNIQGWKSNAELEWMFEFSKRMNSIAEVGVWKGRGTHALCSGCPGRVTVVDPFDPLQYGHPETKLAGGDVLTQFKANMAQFQNLRIWPMASEFTPDDESFDMVFLDGQKAYSDYFRDIARWLPRTRMVIAGYDFRDEEPVGVKSAVLDTFGPSINVFENIWYKTL